MDRPAFAIDDLLLVAIGGSVGAALRYALDAGIARWSGSDLPWGTFTVNVLGAFTLGALTAFVLDRGLMPDVARPALAIGLLGAFTTFSTLAMDAIVLAQAGRVAIAVTYVTASNVLGIMAAVAGLSLVRA